MTTVRLTIDGKQLEVEPGTTVLKAAERLGIEIPTLCHMEGVAPRTSCFVCVVKVEGNDNFLPACTTLCAEGMSVSTASAEVAATRKTAFELLLSDHAGACVAQCAMGCPAETNVPAFTKPMAQGEMDAALGVIRQRLSMPASLGYICPGFCESACIRKKMDESVRVKSLHRVAAERNLAAAEPSIPACKPATGKCVAIVGAGPGGLSAAYFLLQEGHDCILFDASDRAGGALRGMAEEKLPQRVVDQEVALIERMGAQFKFGWRLGENGTLAELQNDFDAVLLAFGSGVNAGTDQRKVDLEWAKALGLKVGPKAIAVEKASMATSIAGVFAAGEAALGPGQMVWSVATGRLAAVGIDQYLKGQPVKGWLKQIYFRKPVSEAEDRLLYGNLEKGGTLLPNERSEQAPLAPAEAGRCLQCGCVARDDCKLRYYSTLTGANFNRFRGARRELAADESHGEIVYEPGKCILCGLCLKIAEEAGEETGLCFVGRGFRTRVTVPLGGDLAQGLSKSARACAEACPTGALALKK